MPSPRLAVNGASGSSVEDRRVVIEEPLDNGEELSKTRSTAKFQTGESFAKQLVPERATKSTMSFSAMKSQMQLGAKPTQQFV